MRNWLALALIVLATPAAAVTEVVPARGFACEDGSLARIEMRDTGAVLQWRGLVYPLSPRSSENGFRFLGNGIDLRGRGIGTEERLALRSDREAPLDCTVIPGTVKPGLLTGSMTYMARMALPPGAVATVELRDTARVDTAAPLIASVRILPRGNQVPLVWRMRYDTGKLGDRARPTLSGRITDASGKLLWISDTNIAAPGADNGLRNVGTEIRLVPATR